MGLVIMADVEQYVLVEGIQGDRDRGRQLQALHRVDCVVPWLRVAHARGDRHRIGKPPTHARRLPKIDAIVYYLPVQSETRRTYAEIIVRSTHVHEKCSTSFRVV